MVLAFEKSSAQTMAGGLHGNWIDKFTTASSIAAGYAPTLCTSAWECRKHVIFHQ